MDNMLAIGYADEMEVVVGLGEGISGGSVLSPRQRKSEGDTGLHGKAGVLF
jgi:hypothetical protein